MFPGLAIPLSVSADHCGRLECRVRRIWVCDCLGLFALPVRPPHPAAVLVEPVPAQMDLPPVPAQKALPVPRGPARAGEDYELRDYRPEDSVRAIHWKLSAKRDQLIVREPLAGQQPLPVLIFDHLGPPEALDESIDRVAGLSLAFQRRGQPHEIRWAHPVSGRTRRFVVADTPGWQRCLAAILSDPAPGPGLLPCWSSRPLPPGRSPSSPSICAGRRITMEKRDRRWLPVLLSAAVSAVAIGLMLGGWLFSLRSICALPVEDGALLLWTVLLSLAAAACSAPAGHPPANHRPSSAPGGGAGPVAVGASAPRPEGAAAPRGRPSYHPPSLSAAAPARRGRRRSCPLSAVRRGCDGPATGAGSPGSRAGGVPGRYAFCPFCRQCWRGRCPPGPAFSPCWRGASPCSSPPSIRRRTASP